MITACQINPDQVGTTSSGINSPDLEDSSVADLYPVVWSAWQAGPHAAGYDLGKGPNTYCAVCHSPKNWDPLARIDDPPNCVSCKFPNEDDVRIAEGNPLVPEDEWKGISCEVCHPQGFDTNDVSIAWFDIVTGYTETVATTTDLCQKCHRDTETLRYQVHFGSQVHTEFTCTDCHEPHSANANCGNMGCHEEVVAVMSIYNPAHLGISDNGVCVECHTRGMDEHTMYIKELGTDNCISCHANLVEILETPAVQLGHTIYHQPVPCSVCHDATNAPVEIDDSGDWVTIRTTELLGRTTQTEFTSHNVQRYVDCLRCHFETNPWDLPTGIVSAPTK